MSAHIHGAKSSTSGLFASSPAARSLFPSAASPRQTASASGADISAGEARAG